MEESNEEKFILGIDPGLTGALVLVDKDGDLHKRFVMPTYETAKKRKVTKGKDKGKTKIGKQNHVDLIKLQMIFDQIAPMVKHAYLEKVGAMPGQGVVAMFTFGKVFGYCEAMLAANKIPYTLVAPQTWTKVEHVGSPKDMKGKDRSRMVIQQNGLVELVTLEGEDKPHEGLIDAFLIARYGAKQ